MTDESGSLRSVVDEAARELQGIDRETAGGVVELRRGRVRFLRLEGARATFRLDPELVAAALRTPDTAPSPLGTEWVTFAPEQLDGPAVDRATAWLRAAWRRAGPADSGTR